MESYSDAQVLEESLTVRERLVRESNIKSDKQTHSTPNGTGLSGTKIHYLSQRRGSRAKRIIDVTLGVLGFISFLLLYPIIALGIKLSSRGPVIYKQKRTGRNGNEFTCFKFRTMHQIELRRIDGKPVVTQQKDKRVFAFGRFLRKTNLDELPQIINVLKGEMSMVGPRPYPVSECSYWNTEFDDFYYRYSVKPGISGLAQIKGYRGGTLDEEHMRKRLDYDLIYVQKSSVAMDLKIIGETILQMLHLDTNAH